MSNFVVPSRLEELLENAGECSSFFVDNVWEPTDFSDSEIQDRIEDELKCAFIDTIVDLSTRVMQSAETNKSLSQQAKNNTKAILYFLSAVTGKVEVAARTDGPSAPATKAATAAANDDSESEEEFTSKKTKASKSKAGKASAAPKGKGKKSASKGCFHWADYRGSLLELMVQAASMEASMLWPMGIVPESYLAAQWGYALSLLETKPPGLAGTGQVEAHNRALCVKIVTRCVASFATSAGSCSATALATAILDGLLRSEPFATTAADLCSKCASSLTAEILGEISRMNLAALPAGGVKNIGAFIEGLAKCNPSLMTAQLPVVMKQLDSSAHQIRSALLHAMGMVIVHIHSLCKQAELTGIPLDSEDAEKEVKIETPAEDADTEGDADSDKESDKSNDQDFRKNPSLLPRVRSSLLDMLVERTHDVSPYSRAAVLKVWQELLEADAIPATRVGSVAEIAVDRLQDKAAAVRKAALSLLTSVVDLNPFGGQLSSPNFTAEKLRIEEAIAVRLMELREISSPTEEDLVAAEVVAESGAGAVLPAVLEEDEEDEDAPPAAKSAATPAEAMRKALETGDPFLTSADVLDDTPMNELKKQLSFCSSALEVIAAIEIALPRASALTHSKTSGDVIESLRFLTRTVNFQVAGAVKAFQRTFALVFHGDASIRQEVLTAFSHVFLTDGAMENPLPLPPAEVAMNLLSICRTCDAAAVASMEEIVGLLFKAEQVDTSVVNALWSRVSVNGTETAAAMRVLSIIAAHLDILSPSRIRQVMAAGLATNDFASMKSAAQILQRARIEPLSLADESNTDYQTALLDCTPGLVNVMMGGLCEDNEVLTREWYAVCEEAVNALFHIHACPDQVLASVITPMYAALATPPETTATQVQCSAARLSRLVFLLGQTALSSLVYSERLSLLAKKAAAAAAAIATTTAVIASAPAASKAKPSKGKKTKSAEPEPEAETPSNERSEDALEDEMGMAAAADADSERLFVLLTERGLVMDNLLGKFHPIVAFIVANQKLSFSSPLLRETSLLALCRYMSVSSILCEQYLPLLFTVLEKEVSEACRTTIMIALGDLAFRFPNALEPWTPHMYARLGDPRVLVRYNALMVLTHLILNDMVKVKGQVTHVVMCLTDTEERVRDLATLFFNKLSERSNNPIYNLLGDIIGTLSTGAKGQGESVENQSSDAQNSSPSKENNVTGAIVAVAALDNGTSVPKRALSAREFQQTMSFLLTFVKKDKQADGMLERLLTRLAMAQSLRQRRCLAYCISELSITDKGVKKMAESVKSIKDALYDEETFDLISTAVAKAKKAAKAVGSTSGAEGKSIIEEFEALLEAIRSDARGEEVNALAEKCGAAVSESGAAAEEEESMLPKKQETKKPAAKKAPAKKAAAKRKPRKADSDEEEEEDDEPAPVKAKGRKAIAAAAETPTPTSKAVSRASSRPQRSRKVLQEINAEDDEEAEF